MYITRAMRQLHGDTDGCTGCMGIAMTHSETCRRRFETLYQGSPGAGQSKPEAEATLGRQRTDGVAADVSEQLPEPHIGSEPPRGARGGVVHADADPAGASSSADTAAAAAVGSSALMQDQGAEAAPLRKRKVELSEGPGGDVQRLKAEEPRGAKRQGEAEQSEVETRHIRSGGPEGVEMG